MIADSLASHARSAFDCVSPHPPRRWFAVLVLATITASAPAAMAQDEPVFSGPQVGESITPFRVLQLAGPDPGKEVEIGSGNQPTVLVFVHEITRPGLQLIRPIDHYGNEFASEGLATHFVWLTADRGQTEEFLNRARQSLNIKSPLSISLDGVEGPGNYGLNRRMTMTILVANEGKVAANFAIVQPNETDAPKVIAAMAKLIGKPAPSEQELREKFGYGRRDTMKRDRPKAEPKRSMEPSLPAAGADSANIAQAMARIEALEQKVVELTAALNDARAKLAKLEGKEPPPPIKPANRPETRKAELPGRASDDPELVGLMRRMIQKTNDDETVERVAAAMIKWRGDDPARAEELRAFCVRVLAAGYGTDAAKAAMKQFAEER